MLFRSHGLEATLGTHFPAMREIPPSNQYWAIEPPLYGYMSQSMELSLETQALPVLPGMLSYQHSEMPPTLDAYRSMLHSIVLQNTTTGATFSTTPPLFHQHCKVENLAYDTERIQAAGLVVTQPTSSPKPSSLAVSQVEKTHSTSRSARSDPRSELSHVETAQPTSFLDTESYFRRFHDQTRKLFTLAYRGKGSCCDEGKCVRARCRHIMNRHMIFDSRIAGQTVRCPVCTHKALSVNARSEEHTSELQSQD